jgi:hypothetical protein
MDAHFLRLSVLRNIEMPPNKNVHLKADVFIWRKGRDSNSRGFHLTVFKTVALDHSATLPGVLHLFTRKPSFSLELG